MSGEATRMCSILNSPLLGSGAQLGACACQGYATCPERQPSCVPETEDLEIPRE